MPTPTYTPLATVTLTSALNSITFGSINQSYRDLILVWSGSLAGNYVSVRFNGGTTGYNYETLGGNGTATRAEFFANDARGYFEANYSLAGGQANGMMHLFDYSQSGRFKTYIATQASAGTGVGMIADRWSTTSAITSIQIYGGSSNNFAIGSTFSLYGVAA